MKHRKSFLLMIGMLLALLLLAGCGAAVTTPTPTRAPVRPTTTPTLALTPPSTPTPISPAVTPTLEAPLSVNLARPLVLRDNQVKLTVTAVGPVVGEGAYIQPARQNTYHLLQLTLSVENVTNEKLWFGPDPNSLEDQGQGRTNLKLLLQAIGVQSTRFLLLKDQTGTALNVGGVEGLGQNSWGYGVSAIQPGSTIEVKVAFVVPNQATQLTATLITVSFK